jgi:hypothetical protein
MADHHCHCRLADDADFIKKDEFDVATDLYYVNVTKE